MNAGGSDPLPLSCFRLQDQRFTVRGGVRPYRAVSGGPSTGRARWLRWHRCCDHSGQPVGCEEVFVWGRSPGELYVSPARQHHVQETLLLLPRGTASPTNAQICFSWRDATELFSPLCKKP